MNLSRALGVLALVVFVFAPWTVGGDGPGSGFMPWPATGAGWLQAALGAVHVLPVEVVTSSSPSVQVAAASSARSVMAAVALLLVATAALAPLVPRRERLVGLRRTIAIAGVVGASSAAFLVATVFIEKVSSLAAAMVLVGTTAALAWPFWKRAVLDNEPATRRRFWFVAGPAVASALFAPASSAGRWGVVTAPLLLGALAAIELDLVSFATRRRRALAAIALGACVALAGLLVWRALRPTFRADPLPSWADFVDLHRPRLHGFMDGDIQAVAVTGSGDRVATAGTLAVKLWDAHDGKLLGHGALSNASRILALAISPRADLLAVAYENEVIAFSLPAFERLWDHYGARNALITEASLRFSADGAFMSLALVNGVAETSSDTVYVYATGSGTAVLQRPDAHAFTFLSPTRGVVAHGPALEIVSLPSGELVQLLALGLPGRVSDVVASPDGRLIACATDADSRTPIVILDATNGAPLATVQGLPGRRWRLDFASPERLVSVSSGPTQAFIVSAGPRAYEEWDEGRIWTWSAADGSVLACRRLQDAGSVAGSSCALLGRARDTEIQTVSVFPLAR